MKTRLLHSQKMEMGIVEGKVKSQEKESEETIPEDN